MLFFKTILITVFKTVLITVFKTVLISVYWIVSPISQTQRQRKRGGLNLKGFMFIIRFDQPPKGRLGFFSPFVN